MMLILSGTDLHKLQNVPDQVIRRMTTGHHRRGHDRLPLTPDERRELIENAGRRGLASSAARRTSAIGRTSS